MHMVPIFDLDDTLYPEITYVESGFFAVARKLHDDYGWPISDSINQMKYLLSVRGRGEIFNKLLEEYKCDTKKNVQICLKTYRQHIPNIYLNDDADRILKFFNNRAYLVTDGHKLVQLNKIKALKLESKFQKFFITHRYGLKNAKPSIHCFDLIKRRENCLWENMFYVGDNPNKDFVNLNQIGIHTIRILTGEYYKTPAKFGFDAKYTIKSLDELPQLLEEISQ
jgi:putative hydrolase of the HAD superfamily